MRRHPEIGEGICRSFPSSRPFASIVRHHHERWDGFGYPDRLRGESIPIGARIVGLVDAFDAMIHDRPFRPALSGRVRRWPRCGARPVASSTRTSCRASLSLIDPGQPLDVRRS